MNILTDEEISQVYEAMTSDVAGSCRLIARAIEAAVLSKLADQGVEPVACYNPNEDEAEDAFNWYCNTGRSDADYPVALYTESQLIAAQQKAAEACAKYYTSNLFVRKYGEQGFHIAIRNGGWREYL